RRGGGRWRGAWGGGRGGRRGGATPRGSSPRRASPSPCTVLGDAAATAGRPTAPARREQLANRDRVQLAAQALQGGNPVLRGAPQRLEVVEQTARSTFQDRPPPCPSPEFPVYRLDTPKSGSMPGKSLVRGSVG